MNYNIPAHVLEKGIDHANEFIKASDTLIKNEIAIKKKIQEINELKQSINNSNILNYDIFHLSSSTERIVQNFYLVETQSFVEQAKELERKTYQLFDLLAKRERIEKKFEL